MDGTAYIAPLQGVACKQAHAACGGVWGEGWRRLVPSARGESANTIGFCA